MIYHKYKISLAAILAGSILLQNFQVLAAPSAVDWLKESPFTMQSKTEPPSQEETEQNETAQTSEVVTTLNNFETESETEAETETSKTEEQNSSSESASRLLMADQDTLSEMLQQVFDFPTTSYTFSVQDMSWKQLQTELTKRINSYSSKWSLYLKDLSTGNVISINENAQESASLIKLYVMGAVMQAIQDGTLEMTDTIHKLLNDMITVSDNTATNELVRYLDSDHDHKKGLEKVNDFIKMQGFENTHEYNGLEDQRLWYSVDTPNTTSAKDCGRLLERIYRGEFVSHLASRQMESLLLDQQVTYKIPTTIPDESRVANKTGETSDCENDAAIVYTPKGDYILCIMSCEVTSKNAAVTYLREMSSLIYRYFMNRDESKVIYQVDASAAETE